MIQERAFHILNLADYRHTGGPLDLGEVDLTPPGERQYILRMAIRAHGSDITIPSELDWIRPMFDRAIASQTQMGIDHPFIYVTIRHGTVNSTSDDEWHVDGFSTKTPHVPEQNYLWCSDDAFEYSELNVAFPDDFDPRRHNIHRYLAQHVTEVSKAKSRTLYCMDPYVIHRRPSSTTGTYRTFVRISFVPIQINDVNNTPNPHLDIVSDFDGVAFRNQLEIY